MVISLRFLPGGEVEERRASMRRGPLGAPDSIKEAYLDRTASKRNEVVAGLSSASAVRLVRNAG